MGTTTHDGMRIGKKGSLAGVPKLLLLTASFDATIAASAKFKLPSNAIIVGVGSVVGDLDQVLDTVDVGTTEGGAEIVNELVAGVSQAVTGIVGLPLVDDYVYVGVGGVSTGTAGGTAKLVIEYYLEDPRVGVNN